MLNLERFLISANHLAKKKRGDETKVRGVDTERKVKARGE